MNKIANYEKFAKEDSFVKGVNMLTELYNQKVYQKTGKIKGEFSKKYNYKTKNIKAHEAIKKFAAEASGVDIEQMEKAYPQEGAFRNPMFTDAYFAVIERTIDSVNVKSELEEALQFAEIRNLADGDSALFDVKGKGFIDFHKDARGKRNNVINKTFMENFTLTPEVRRATVSVNLYKLAAGNEDLGDLINKVILGQKTQMYSEIYELLFETGAATLNAIELLTITQENLMELAQKVQGLNRCTEDQTFLFGTRLALSPILPSSTELLQGSTLGNTMNKEGYLADGGFGAFKMIALSQGKKSQDATLSDFVIPNDYALMMCMAGTGDKPVKIATEGVTRSYVSRDGDTANNEMVRTISMAWDMKIISAMHFGLVKTR